MRRPLSSSIAAVVAVPFLTKRCAPHSRLPKLLALGLGMSFAASALAADQTYDPVNAANVWDLTTLNWDTSTASWTNGNSAIFGGTGETVTVTGAPIIFDNMTFSATGYTIADGAGSLLLSNDLASSITVSTGTATIAESLGDNAGGASTLTKAGAGTLVLSGNNSYTGTTTLSAGILSIGHANALGATSAGTVQSGASELRLTGGIVTAAEPLSITGGGINNAGALRNFSGDNTYSGTVTLAGQTRIVSDSGTMTLSAATSVTVAPAANQNLIVSGAGNITISGAITTGTGFLSKDALIGNGTGTLTLGGTNTYTGTTTVTAGTLKLDYGTNNTSKLSDTAALILGGGTVELAGGTHTELVSATTLNASTTSVISRSSGSAVLQLNTVTANAGAALVVTGSGIATSDNPISNGILGFWARTNINGVPTWATSGGTADSPIVAFTGYTDINRLGGIVPNLATNHVRIVEGGTSGDISLGGGALTQAYTLQVDASGGRTTIPVGGTDVLNMGDNAGGAIWQTAGAGGLTIGTTAGSGILTAGATASANPANLRLINDSVTNNFVVNSLIANNGTDVVSVTSSGAGTIVLNANNTFTGSLTAAGSGPLILTGNNAARPNNVASSTVVATGGVLQLQANAGNTTGGVSTVLFNEQSGTLQPFILSTGGTLQLRSDSSVTFAGGNNFGGLGSATVNIDVNQLTGTGANNTLTFAPGGFNVNTTTFNVTGGNGYRLSLGKINNVTGAAATVTLNPTTATMSVAGYTGTTAFASTLALSGTSSGNTVTGPITDTTSATPAVISVTKTGSSTWELAGENTYTGTTNVRQGTLTLSGNRTANTGTFTIGDTAGLDGTLNITNGNFSLGTATFFVSTQVNSSTVNQSGGSISFTGGTQLIIGNTAVGSVGTYNLSGGTLTGGAVANRGVILGTNGGTTGIFNLSGTGNLAMGTSTLQVGRSDGGDLNTTGIFNQTGGTASIGTLTVGGGTIGVNPGTKGTLNLTGGVFSATNFTLLAAAGNASANITIGGTAQVTLPAFPTARGIGATAAVTFDGGTLSPAAASTTYMEGLTSASLTANGAKFDVPSGRDINVAQAFQNAAGQAGTLTKLGDGVLTLSGESTYTGATTVNAGTLLVSGAISASSTTVNSGGILGAGIAVDTIGIGTTGPLSLANTGTFKLDLAITDSTTVATDLINVNGNLSLSGSPVLALQNIGSNVALTPGTAITFLDYSGTWNGGTFAGLADDSTFTLGANQFRISYNGVNNNDTAVTLVAVPEPGSAVLLLSGVASLLGLRRRRRSA